MHYMRRLYSCNKGRPQRCWQVRASLLQPSGVKVCSSCLLLSMQPLPGVPTLRMLHMPTPSSVFSSDLHVFPLATCTAQHRHIYFKYLTPTLRNGNLSTQARRDGVTGHTALACLPAYAQSCISEPKLGELV